MSDDPLSQNEQDIAELAAARTGFDGYLAQLIVLADEGVPTYIGMIVNGIIVFGTLSSADKIAKSIDEHLSWLADASRKGGMPPEEVSAEEFESSLQSFSSGATTAYEAHRAETDEVADEARPYSNEDGNLDFRTAPARVARRVVRLWYRHSITLTEVQVFAPGQAGLMRLPVMRVTLDQVSAWWIVPLDSEGQASFKLFSTENS
jgi:hypothetical protein